MMRHFKYFAKGYSLLYQSMAEEVDRIFNGSKDPTEQQGTEASEPTEQEEQVPSATEGKHQRRRHCQSHQ